MDKTKLCYSADQETFRDDLESALGDLSYFTPGAVIECGDSIPVSIQELVWVDHLLDEIQEHAYDEVGESAQDWLMDIPQAAKDELQRLIVAWIEKHDPPKFWKVENVRPYTLTAEDLGLGAAPPDLQCEKQTKQGHRCGNIPKGRSHGRSLCARHLREAEKSSADAEQRWKDAGEPEGDL